MILAYNARQSYWLDITGFFVAYEQCLSIVFDLKLWTSDMIFVCNTSSCHDNYLFHIIYKSQHRSPSYGQTQTGFTEIYAQSLSADCDIDLWSRDMVLVRDTLFCHDYHLYQIIFKSDHAWQRYGSDMNKLHWKLCTKFKSWLWPSPIT